MERATEGAKQCGLCEKAKPLADFYKVGTTRDGYSKRCKECQREQARVRHLAKFDPVKAEAYRVKCLYGVTLVEIAERWLAQGERCVICRTEGEPVVEHDHQTGEFRGLTSSNCTCNQAMGLFKDDPERCLAAYHYLKAARCVEVGA
jgi:hypothetical protein